MRPSVHPQPGLWNSLSRRKSLVLPVVFHIPLKSVLSSSEEETSVLSPAQKLELFQPSHEGIEPDRFPAHKAEEWAFHY